MNSLSNYIFERIFIAERIRIDNIKRKEFPIDGSLKNVIEFLKSNGFVQLNYSNFYDWMALYIDDFKHKLPEFEIVKQLNAIVFANTSKHDISEDNPMWYIQFNKSHSKPIKWKKCTGPDSSINTRSTLLSKVDFKSEMEKYFENL